MKMRKKPILKKQIRKFYCIKIRRTLIKPYVRFEKLISQLEIYREVYSQEDANLKCAEKSYHQLGYNIRVDLKRIGGHSYYEGEKILKDGNKESEFQWQRNCYQMGLESLEARIVVHEKNEAVYEKDIAFLNYDVQVNEWVHSVFNSKESDGDDNPVNDRSISEGFRMSSPSIHWELHCHEDWLIFARVNNVTTVGPKAVVSSAMGNGENTVKSSACWI
ncbi:hypothetical protein Tco_0420968 [Tanacetum coccineum]